MLIKRNKDLIEQLTKPKRLDDVKPIGVANEEVWRRRKKNNLKNDELEQEDEDPSHGPISVAKGSSSRKGTTEARNEPASHGAGESLVAGYKKWDRDGHPRREAKIERAA